MKRILCLTVLAAAAAALFSSCSKPVEGEDLVGFWGAIHFDYKYYENGKLDVSHSGDLDPYNPTGNNDTILSVTYLTDGNFRVGEWQYDDDEGIWTKHEESDYILKGKTLSSLEGANTFRILALESDALTVEAEKRNDGDRVLLRLKCVRYEGL